MNPQINIKMAFEFVSGSGPNPVNPAAQTGDIAVMSIAVIIALFALVVGGLVFMRKFAFAGKIGSHTKTKLNIWKSTKAKVIAGIVAAIAASLLIASGMTIATQNKAAIADSNSGGYTADEVIAYVDEDTGQISFEETWLKNVGTESLRIDESYVTICEEAKAIAGLKTSNFIMKSGLGGNIFEGSPDGTVYRTNRGTPTLRDLPVGETTSLNFELTGLSGENAKQLIGKHVFDVTFNQDSIIPQTEVPDPTPEKLTQTYTGSPLHLLEPSLYYVISGENEATDPGTYTAIVEPAQGGVWPDKTSTPKRYVWTIVNPYIRTEWQILPDFTYDGKTHSLKLLMIDGVLPQDQGHLDFTYIIEKDGSQVDSAINQGTYTIKVDKLIDDRTGQETDVYDFDKTTSTEFIINPRPITVTWDAPQPAAWVYNGEAKTRTATITNKVGTDTVDIDTYSIEKFEGDTWIAVEHAIDAGKYRFTPATLKNNTNDNYTVEGATDITSDEVTITPKLISGVNVVVSSTGTEYNGTEQLPNLASVTDPDMDDERANLTLNVDYTISDSSKLKDVQAEAVPIILVGKGNYSGTKTSATWNLTPKTVSLEWTTADYVYDGTEHKPTATVTGTVASEEGTVEVVSYAYTNKGTQQTAITTNAGDFTATATGGLKYIEEATATLNYKLPTGTAASFNYSVARKSLGDLGEDFGQTQKVDLFYDGNVKEAFGTASNQGNLVPLDKRTTVTKHELTYGTDFTTTSGATGSTSSATAAGDYEVIINGVGNYSGSVAVPWKIKQRDISVTTDTDISVEISKINYDYVYDGGGHYVDLVVKINGNVVSPENYEVSSDFAINVGEHNYSITGKKNLTGIRNGQWTISQAEIKYFEVYGDRLTVDYTEGESHTVSGYAVYAFSDAAATKQLSFVDKTVLVTNVSTEITQTYPGYYTMGLTNETIWTIAEASQANVKIADGATHIVSDGFLSINDPDAPLKIIVTDTTSETSKAEYGDKVTYTITVKNDSQYEIKDILVSAATILTDDMLDYYHETINSIASHDEATLIWEDTTVHAGYFNNLSEDLIIRHSIKAKGIIQSTTPETYETAGSSPTYLKRTEIDLPTDPGTLVYNASTIDIQNSFPDLNGKVSFSGYEVPTDAGEYSAPISLSQKYLCWTGGSTDPTTIDYEIHKAPLSITAPDNTITFGDKPGIGSGNPTSYGLQGNDKLGEMSYTYNYEQYGNVGDNYMIIPSMAASKNYEVSYTNGTLTVIPYVLGFTWPPEDECAYPFDDKPHLGPDATVVDPFNGETTLPSLSYKSYDESGETEILSPQDIGIYTRKVVGLSSENYTITGSDTTSCKYTIYQSKFSVTFAPNNPSWGKVKLGSSGQWQDSVVIEDIDLGCQISWQLSFGYDQLFGNKTDYTLLVFDKDGNLIKSETIYEQYTSSDYHFNMWTQNGEKLSMKSDKFDITEDLTMTAEFSDKSATERIYSFDKGPSAGKFNYTGSFMLEQSTTVQTDEYGNLSFSTLNLVLTPKINKNYYLGAWYHPSRGMLIPNEPWNDPEDLVLGTAYYDGSISGIKGFPVNISPITSMESSGQVSSRYYACYENGTHVATSDSTYALDNNDITKVIFTNGYGYKSSVYASPDEGSNFTGWYTVSASTQRNNPLEQGKEYKISKNRDKLDLFAGFCSSNFVSVTSSVIGEGIGSFSYINFEGATVGTTSVWIPKGSDYTVEKYRADGDAINISYDGISLGVIWAVHGANSTFDSWNVSSQTGKIDEDTNFQARFNKVPDTKWYDINVSCDNIDGVTGSSVDRSTISVPEGSIVSIDIEDMYKLNVFSDETESIASYIDTITFEAEEGCDFAGWWIKNTQTGDFQLFKSQKVTNDVTLKAISTPTAKAVYTESVDNSSLTFYYDKSNHTSDEGFKASYPITLTDISLRTNPKWYGKVNPTNIVFDSSFANYKYYGSAADFRCGMYFYSLNGWFMEMDNIKSISGFENIKFNDNSETPDLRYLFAHLNSPELTIDLTNFKINKAIYLVGNNTGVLFYESNVNTLKIPTDFLKDNTSLKGLFESCYAKQIDFVPASTQGFLGFAEPVKFASNATTTNGMFRNCKLLENINVEDFDVTNNEDFSQMFYGCAALRKADLRNFIPVFEQENIPKMDEMLASCELLEEIDISGFNIRGKEDAAKQMLAKCQNLNRVTIGPNWTANLEFMCGANSYGNWYDKDFNVYQFNNIVYPSTKTGPVTFAKAGTILFGVVPETECRASLVKGEQPYESFYGSVSFNPLAENSARYKLSDDGQSATITVKELDDDGLVQDVEYTTYIDFPQGVTVDSWRTDPEVAQETPITQNTRLSAILNLTYTKAVLSTDQTTLTFYYDKTVHTEGSQVVTIDPKGKAPVGMFSGTVKNVIFDSSMANIPDDKKITSLAYWFEYFEQLKSVQGWEYINGEKLENIEGMFRNCTSLVTMDLSKLNLPSIVTMQSVFSQCRSLTSVIFPVWASVAPDSFTDTSHMFEGTESLRTLDLSGFDTSKVTNMACMFVGSGIENLTFAKQDGTTKFSTESVTNFDSMFLKCENLKSLDLKTFNTNNCTNFYQMFVSCSSLKDLDVSSFSVDEKKIIGGEVKEVNHNGMLNNLINLRSITIGSDWHSSLGACGCDKEGLYKGNAKDWTSTKFIFAGGDGSGPGTYYCPIRIEITSNPSDSMGTTYPELLWNPAIPLTPEEDIAKNILRLSDGSQNPTEYKCMPKNKSLELDSFVYSPPLEAGKITQSTRIYAIYNGMDARAVYTEWDKTLTFYYDALDHPGEEFPVSEGDESSPESPFKEVADVTEHVVIDKSFSGYENVVDLYYWFDNFIELKDIKGFTNINSNQIKSTEHLFNNCSKLAGIFDMSVMNFQKLFSMAAMFDGCKNLEVVNMSNVIAPYVNNFSNMFNGCENLTSVNLDGASFCMDGDPYNLYNASSMFNNCNKLSYIDITPFDFGKDNFNCSQMFGGCVSLESIKATSSKFNSNFKVAGLDPEQVWYNSSSTNMSDYYPVELPTSRDVVWVKGQKIIIDVFPPGNGDIMAMGEILDLSDFDLSHPPGYEFLVSVEGETLHIAIKYQGMSQSVDFLPLAYTEFDKWTFDPEPVDGVLDGNAKITALFTGASAKAVDMGNGTLKFVYDENEYPSQTVYYVSALSDPPMWQFGDAQTVSKYKHVIIDDSFKNFSALKSTYYWFNGFTGLQDIQGLGNINFTNVESVGGMFKGCTSLLNIDLSSFITPKCKDFSELFKDCTGLTNVNFSKAAFSSSENRFYSMFENCTSLQTVDLSGFRFGTMFNHSIDFMFSGDVNLKTILVSDEWNNNVYSDRKEGTFENCESLVGGQGTTIQYIINTLYGKPDGKFAIIDKGADNPGLLTLKEEPKAYGVYYNDSNELKLYFDKHVHADEGQVFDIPTYNESGKSPFNEVSQSVTTVTFDSTFADYDYLQSMAYWFSGFKSLNEVNNLNYVNTGRLSNLSYMLSDCVALKSINLTGFNTSNVIYMDGMFSRSGITTVDLTTFNFNSAQRVNSMFSECEDLASINFGNEGINMPAVVEMDYMFSRCSSLESIDMSKFKVQKLNSIEEMFADCSSLESVNFDNFNSKYVSNMSGLFKTNSGVQYCPITNIDFSNCDLSSLSDIDYMFQGCKNLKKVNFGANNKINMTDDLNYVFDGCESLTSIDFSNFTFNEQSSIGNQWFGTFRNCYNLETIYVDADKFVPKPGASGKEGIYCSDSTFESCLRLQGQLGTTYDDVKDGLWEHDNQWTYYLWVDEGKAHPGLLTDVNKPMPKAKYYESTQELKIFSDPVTTTPISDTCMRIVSDPKLEWPEDISDPYSYFSKICRVEDVKTVTFEDSFRDSGFMMKSLNAWFMNFNNLTTINNIEYINTSNVSAFMYMFYGCSSLSGTLDLANFAPSEPASIAYMFYNCSKLEIIDISNLRYNFLMTASNKMSLRIQEAFNGCEKLTTIFTSPSFNASAEMGTDVTLFENCQLLKGQEGTAYADDRPSKNTALYARPDEGASGPGYFSSKTPKAVLCGTDPAASDLTLKFYWDDKDHSKDEGKLEYYPEEQLAFNNDKASASDWGYDNYRSQIKYVVVDDSFKNYFGITSIAKIFGCDEGVKASASMCNLQNFTGLENLKVNNVRDMSCAFRFTGYNNPDFEGIDGIQNWETYNAVNMSNLFEGYGHSNINLHEPPQTANWDTSKVEGMAYMFADYGSFATDSPQTQNFDFKNITTCASMFEGSKFLHAIYLDKLGQENFNYNGKLDFNNMFANCSQLTTIRTDFDSERYSSYNIYDGMFDNCVWLPNYNSNTSAYNNAHPLTYLTDTPSGYFTPYKVLYRFSSKICSFTDASGTALKGVEIEPGGSARVKFVPRTAEASGALIYDYSGAEYVLDSDGWLTLEHKGYNAEILVQANKQTITWSSSNVGKVEVNGSEVKTGAPIKEGDDVRVYASKDDRSSLLTATGIVDSKTTSRYPIYKHSYAEFSVGKYPITIREVSEPGFLIEIFATPEESGVPSESDWQAVSAQVTKGVATLNENNSISFAVYMGERINPMGTLWPANPKAGWAFDHWEYSINSGEWKTITLGNPVETSDDTRIKMVYKQSLEYMAITCTYGSVDVSLKNFEGLDLWYAPTQRGGTIDKWYPVTQENIGTLSQGQTVYVKGSNDCINSSEKMDPIMNPTNFRFSASKEGSTIGLSGNIMSLLLNEDGTYKTTVDEPYSLAALFAENSTIETVSENFLPASSVSNYAYWYMFGNCNNLLNMPNLPATTLGDHCYENMFKECKKMKTAVDKLPASTLKPYCYSGMFTGCQRLEADIELPANTLVSGCYQGMFDDCQKLKGISFAFDDWMYTEEAEDNPTKNWLRNAGVYAYEPLVICSKTAYATSVTAIPRIKNSSFIPDHFFIEFSDDADNIIDAGPGITPALSEANPDSSQNPATPQESEGTDPSEEQAIVPEPEMEPEAEAQPVDPNTEV